MPDGLRGAELAARRRRAGLEPLVDHARRRAPAGPGWRLPGRKVLMFWNTLVEPSS